MNFWTWLLLLIFNHLGALFTLYFGDRLSTRAGNDSLCPDNNIRVTAQRPVWVEALRDYGAVLNRVEVLSIILRF